MNLKSRSIFKNFSVVFLLLLIVTAVFIPLGEARAAGDFFSFDVFSNIEDWIAKALLGDNVFMRAIYFLAYQLLNICLLVVTILVYFGSWLVDVFLDEQIYLRVLDMSDPTSAVSIGWTTVRDFCNTFFILFLLLIAFSTILRIQAYSAKSLLPKLIISLFLINFSAVIAMMVIDFGQVFMFEIKTWMGAGGFSEAGSPLTTIVDYFNKKYDFGSPTGKYLLSDVVGVAFAVAYSVILGLLYIMLALFLMVRIIVFVILVIISPFAFFSIILPGMRTYTSQWWQSLVSHAIFGPVFLFFIFLSGKMAQSMHGFNSSAAKPAEIDSSLSYIIIELIPHVVALGMLMAAIPVTQKLGVAGSSKIIGGVGGIGKVGIGAIAGAKLAGGAGKKVGGAIKRRSKKVAGVVEGVKGWQQRQIARIPLVGKGAALGNKAEQEKTKQKNIDDRVTKYGGELKSIDVDLAMKGDDIDKAVGLKAAAAQGKLGDRNKDGSLKYGKAFTAAQDHLSNKDTAELTDKNLEMATMTRESQRRINNKDLNSFDEKAQKRINDKGGTKEAYTEEIMKEKMNDIVKDGNAYNVGGLGNELAAKVWKGSQTGEQRKSSQNRMNEENREELSEGYLANIRELNGDGDVINGKGEVVVKDGEAGFKDEKAKIDEEDNMEFSSNAVKLGKGLEESFAWGGDDAAEKIKKAFPEFGHSDVAKMSAEDLDNHGYSATTQQINGLNRAGEYKTVRRIYASMARRAGDPTTSQDERDDLNNRANRGRSNPINPSPDKGSGSGGGGKDNNKQGGGKDQSTFDDFKGGPRQSNMDDFGSGGGGEAGGSGGSGETANPKPNPKPNKSRKPFWKDESAEVGLTGSESSSVADGNIGKDVEKREQNTLEKTGASEKKTDKVIGAFSHDPIIGGKTIKAGLKVGGKFDKRIKTVGEVVSPLIDDEMKMKKEIKKRRKSGEEISPTQELKEKLEMVKEPLKTTVSENADEGVKVAGDRAGAALDKIGERGGKIGAAAKVASKVVGNEQVRKAVSKKAKRLADQDQDEQPAIRTAATKENKILKPEEEQKLSRQKVFDKMNAINLQALGSIQEKNKGKDPQEGLKELGNLKGSLSKLIDESQDIINGDKDGDLPIIAQGVEGGIETARGILQKRIAEQEKGSSGSNRSSVGRSVKHQVLPRQEAIEKMHDINNQALKSIGEGKNPEEELARLDSLKNSLLWLYHEGNNKKEIRKDDNDMSAAFHVAGEGIEGAKKVLQKRIAEQEKGSSGSVEGSSVKEIKPVELGRAPAQAVKPVAKPDRVSIEDLEMKDIEKEYGDRKEMSKATIGTKQIEIAQSLGLRGRGVDNRIVHSELAKNKYAKRMILNDKMNDINYKMAKAKKSGGSGAEEVKELFAEKKNMAKAFVEETNPDLMRDIRYEEGMIEKMRGANKRGEGRRLQSKRRGNLDRLKKEKGAKVDEVLSGDKGGNKGFREREAIRTEKKIARWKSDANYVDLSETKKADPKPQSEKTGTLKKVIAGGNLSVAKNMAKGKDPVATNEALLKALEVSGKFDKRAKKIEPVVRPMIEKQLEIDKRRQGGEKISQWQEDKEKLGALKGGLKKIMPKDTKNDGKYVEEVGKLLSELGKEKGGKVGAVMTGAGKVLQNEKAQKVISKEARNRIDKVETPKQPKPKQQTVKETEQEKIIETRESATKKGGKVEKSSVVKSEITFDPNVSAEMAEQIKEAMRGVSNDMTQKINNKIEVNSPQEAVDIDFEKIIDADKIAEIVKKGIDIKDVEKTFKDVKKSFDEFKGNNNESSSTTVFGAGISAAQTALDKTLTIKDRKERDIKLATITKVMNEIKSGMKKQNRPSIKKEE